MNRENFNVKPACVSLGPGDPELITLKALKALKHADIIYAPAFIKAESNISRARDIMIDLKIDKDKIELFHVPMDKNRSFAMSVYKDIAQKIGREYKNGKRVAYVAEGDAGFYSSAHYISDYLNELNIDVDQIAGVPAFIACGSMSGLHIVKQDEPLSVYPSNITEDQIAKDVYENKTVVIMKLSRNEKEIKQLILKEPNLQFNYFENVGLDDKSFYTTDINVISNRDFPYFSLMIIKRN